ncbi:unnamed protein product, partial [Polarella glacialis]
VPIDLDRTLANFNVEEVSSCAKTWSSVTVQGAPPSGRASHTATALDSFRFVVIGGGSCNSDKQWTHFSDAHVFDVRTKAWQQLAPEDSSSGFPARRGHAAALWRADQVLVFGGASGGSTDDGLLNDCWCLDAADPSWRQLRQRGTVPPRRRGSLGFMAAGHFLLAGGYARVGQATALDPFVYVLDPGLETWSRAMTAEGNPVLIPVFSLAAGAALGPDIFIFGGYPSVGFLWLKVRGGSAGAKVRDGSAGASDAAENAIAAGRRALTVEASQCSFQGEEPSSRYCHGMASIANRWLLIFGGTSCPEADAADGPLESRTLNDSFLLDLRSCGGSSPVVHGRQAVAEGPSCVVPEERNGFAMVSAGTKFVVFGGGVFGEKYYNDTWVLDLQLTPNVAIPVATPGADLGSDLAWLHESPEGLALADLTVMVGENLHRRSFQVHKAVLCARCDYFRALLAGSFREGSGASKEVALPDGDAAAFEQVLAYIYTGRLGLPRLHVVEDCEDICHAGGHDEPASLALSVLLCADRFGLGHLGLLCQQQLAHSLRSSNVCEFLEVADELCCSQLRLVCVHFLKRHYNRCRQQKSFAALPAHLREEVLWAVQGL